eukprot:CAMPEP_0181322674 /NCGR_PEP_ID=MMETSP1101-20121128/19354_1 /TAXON_ID=46948 /ORGANISM="Rhodomonas abbreviata, Strain Caron Lab Isolate" /LENGTH=374 /DNA_ID=CAMNT_0023430603 /DNA_START=58 /DNA_END=1179 /DNA_ORIENTATION=+
MPQASAAQILVYRRLMIAQAGLEVDRDGPGDGSTKTKTGSIPQRQMWMGAAYGRCCNRFMESGDCPENIVSADLLYDTAKKNKGKPYLGVTIFNAYNECKREVVNEIAPLWVAMLNQDGSIPSGKTKDELIACCLKQCWDINELALVSKNSAPENESQHQEEQDDAASPNAVRARQPLKEPREFNEERGWKPANWLAFLAYGPCSDDPKAQFCKKMSGGEEGVGTDAVKTPSAEQRREKGRLAERALLQLEDERQSKRRKEFQEDAKSMFVAGAKELAGGLQPESVSQLEQYRLELAARSLRLAELKELREEHEAGTEAHAAARNEYFAYLHTKPPSLPVVGQVIAVLDPDEASRVLPFRKEGLGGEDGEGSGG